MLGGLVNRSGGNVEVFDDHWAGKHLKSERTWLVEEIAEHCLGSMLVLSLIKDRSNQITYHSGVSNRDAIS
jgi:hypothetical protein